MYDPINDGIEKGANSVVYNEAKPPGVFADVVHNYWELKTARPLSEDFLLHALPDACVNILFNQQDTRVAGVTALHTTYRVLNLGKSFHYAGIQFFPGVWLGDLGDTTDSFVGSPYQGQLPLIKTGNALAEHDFPGKEPVFSALVAQLVERRLVGVNVVIQRILSSLDLIHSVADMAELTHLSTRQLQRTVKASTGFSPHDFLKVVRLQQALKHRHIDSYTDQSHFIHSFKKITGYTPAEYYRKYDV